MTQSLPLHIILLFPVLFILNGLLVFFFISRRSGWYRLAKKFRCEGHFTGKTYPFRGARMRKARFKGSLIIGVHGDGLYLVPIIIFRLFHPPLLIPWKELQAEPIRLFFFTGHQLTVTSMPDITIQISEDTWRLMSEYLRES